MFWANLSALTWSDTCVAEVSTGTTFVCACVCVNDRGYNNKVVITPCHVNGASVRVLEQCAGEDNNTWGPAAAQA